MSDPKNFDGILPLVVRDGAILHRKVPAQRWCVTRDDLLQFRRIVKQFVTEGKITPTELDNFDVADNTVGPCIHTVNAQLIMPVTDRAGKVSWALMLHPEGLECDVFVTHCWQEGIYEFIDKVLHSWPHGARGAYCCMLSNPQNLDISDLIGSPRESPFAKALQSSTQMMVVSNGKCSIYSRIWCAYEAFLAYSQSKVIFTASTPIPNLTRNVLGVLLIEAIVALASFTWSLRFEVSQFGNHEEEWVHDVEKIVAFIAFWCVFFAVAINPGLLADLLVCTASILSAATLGFNVHLMAVSYSRNGLVGSNSSTQVCDTWIFLSFCMAAALSEADVLHCANHIREAAQLRNGYTGKLLDAQSSVAAGKENIQAEVFASGVAEDVDNAIRVLLDSGMSTPTIRLAVSRVGGLQHAGHVTMSTTCLAWAIWVFMALIRMSDVFEGHWYVANFVTANFATDCEQALDYGECCQYANEISCQDDWWCYDVKYCSDPLELPDLWISLFGVLEALAWLLLFSCLRADKRGFAAKAMVRVLLLAFGPILVAEVVGVSITNNPLYVILHLVLAPAILLLAAAGPGRTAGVPVIGPRLVKMIMARISFSGCKWVRGNRLASLDP